METKNWRQECERLQAELDIIRLEASEWKEKFERLALWKEQPRLPARGITLDCVGIDASSTKGKTSTQTYTTMGHRSGDDGK